MNSSLKHLLDEQPTLINDQYFDEWAKLYTDTAHETKFLFIPVAALLFLLNAVMGLFWVASGQAWASILHIVALGFVGRSLLDSFRRLERLPEDLAKVESYRQAWHEGVASKKAKEAK